VGRVNVSSIFMSGLGLQVNKLGILHSSFMFIHFHFTHNQNDTSTEKHSNSLGNLRGAIQRRLDIFRKEFLKLQASTSKGILTCILQEVERRIRYQEKETWNH